MICITCKQEKELTQFYKRKDRKRGVYSSCKDCFNKYCSKRWTEIKKRAIEYKGGKCERCGYKKYHGALEFHHIDPSIKDPKWGKGFLRKNSWEKITKEIDKCMLLCSNCHREIHNEILNNLGDIPDGGL